MKANEIQVGGIYSMRVSGNITQVKVIDIRARCHGRTVYDCINVATGRKCQARSASKPRAVVVPGFQTARPADADTFDGKDIAKLP